MPLNVFGPSLGIVPCEAPASGWAGNMLVRSLAQMKRRTSGCGLRLPQTGLILLSILLSTAVLSSVIASTSNQWLAWCALLPLLAAIRIYSPNKAFACGLLWGASLFAFLSWGANPVIPFTPSAFALLSLIPAGFAFLGAAFTRRFGFNPLILGFGWAGVELALIPLKLNGGLLAGANVFEPGTVSHLLYGVFGYVCMASAIAAVNGLILTLGSHVCQAAGSLGWYIHRSGQSLRQGFRTAEAVVCSIYFVGPSQPRAPPQG